MTPHDRLQPALLDRLTDLDPQSQVESEDSRVMNKARMREAVLRDLSWLLNAVQPLGAQQAAAYPEAAASALNYGLPPLSGQLASRIDIGMLERFLKQAIVGFEPRIMADTLRVKAIETDSVLDTHNVIEFEISGFIWAQPVPLELLLRTQLDLEAGQVVVREARTASTRRRA
jgi:type VI secretion system protein ImpF